MKLINSFINRAFEKDVFDVIIESARRAGGFQVICVLYIISIVFVLLYLRHTNDRTKSVLGIYTIVVIFVILNPIFALALIKLNGDSVYWRTFWLLFIQIAIVYTIIEVSFLNKKRWMRTLIMFLGLVCIVYTGKYMYSFSNFQRVDNYYKVPDDVLDIVEKVVEDKNENKVLAGPIEFQVFTRQIDSGIKLTNGRSEYGPKTLCGYIESGMLDKISQEAISTKTNYIVIDNKYVEDNNFEKFGWKKMHQNNLYTLYKNN